MCPKHNCQSSFLINVFLSATTPHSLRRGVTQDSLPSSSLTCVHTLIRSIIFKFLFKAKAIFPGPTIPTTAHTISSPHYCNSPLSTPCLPPSPANHCPLCCQVVLLKSYTAMALPCFNMLVLLKALRIKSKCLKTAYQAVPDQPPFLPYLLPVSKF